jgi:hypothetical protein
VCKLFYFALKVLDDVDVLLRDVLRNVDNILSKYFKEIGCDLQAVSFILNSLITGVTAVPDPNEPCRKKLGLGNRLEANLWTSQKFQLFLCRIRRDLANETDIGTLKDGYRQIQELTSSLICLSDLGKVEIDKRY